MNVAFQRASHKVLLDDDNLLPLLHLTVDYQGKEKGEAAALWCCCCCRHLVACFAPTEEKLCPLAFRNFDNSATWCFPTESSGSRDGNTPPQDTSPREAPPTGWAALGLSYKVKWPLHILFTPAVLEK